MSNWFGLSSKFNHAFPTPKYLSFDPVSIDVSSQKIRVMKLRRSNFGFVPSLYKEIEVSKENDLSEIANQDDPNSKSSLAMIDVLKSLKKELKLKYVVVSLPGLKAYTFRIQLPKEVSGDIPTAIRFNLEENVPLPPDEVNFDYFIINEKMRGPDDDFDIVISAFPKSVIDIYTRIFHESGLTPISFQVESVSLAAAVIRNDDKNPYLIIRFLEDRADIVIVEQNIVQYASSVSISVKDILDNPDHSQAGLELKESLNRLLVFWFTNRDYDTEHKKIKTALLVGDNASDPLLQEFLEKHLRIDIGTANVWSNCFNINDYVPEMKENESLNYAVAIGHAINVLRKSI